MALKLAALIFGVLIIGIVFLIGLLHYRVISTDAYNQAITIAESSPEVRDVLGSSIRVQIPVTGFVINSSSALFTTFCVRLVGSKGSGHLCGVANAVNGSSEFSRLSLHVAGTTRSTDLAPKPQFLAVPAVPTKKIYLVPIGLDSAESLDWAPEYYKAKLGIEVEILPAIAMPNDLEDHKRHQIDSEHLLFYISSKYSELLKYPSHALVAVTSRDIFIRNFGRSFAENYRQGPHLAVVSCARLHLPALLERWNPEWFHSRLQKMLTKNIAILYFDLPMSSDYTSLLSGGVLSGYEVDLMSGSIVGAERQWDPFVESGDLETSIETAPGQPPVWRLDSSRDVLQQIPGHLFNADLTIGLFVSRQADFIFGGDYPLQFVRVYRNLDPQSRPFGIGTNDSLDIFLVGQMGSYIDLVFEDGGKLHFAHAPYVAGQRGDIYLGETADGGPFSRARAIFAGGSWTIERRDGWKFEFPYRPHALSAYVTVLTGFSDPAGHKYEMIRDEFGALLSVTTPAGRSLQFLRDPQHLVRSIADSSGRTVTYSYDAAERLSRVVASDGYQESYSYNDKSEMLSITPDGGDPILVNTYDITGDIMSQTMSTGEKLEYHYTRDADARGNVTIPDLITAPDGLLTYIQYQVGGYTRSLPLAPPQ
jgi:YD repeat-containing protein